MSYIDELAAQIEREVPSEMLPRRDITLLSVFTRCCCLPRARP